MCMKKKNEGSVSIHFQHETTLRLGQHYYLIPDGASASGLLTVIILYIVVKNAVFGVSYDFRRQTEPTEPMKPTELGCFKA